MADKCDVRAYVSAARASKGALSGARASIFRGDCKALLSQVPNDCLDIVVTSPPYCMGMEYEKSTSVQEFLEAHEEILPEIVRVVRPGGSICWQIGYHVVDKVAYPLDYAVYSILQRFSSVFLRNRIIWTFAHGLHGSSRFSGRHETVLWFTKGRDYSFNLDAVRVPQKYPGKRHYKGPSKGEFSCNPLGKNPGDVWEIPNVKGNHVEKAGHPCQFPVALVQRLVRGLCPVDGLVFDPFMGSASTGVAALVEGRRFLGAELDKRYFRIAEKRLVETSRGNALFRPIEKPIFVPDPRSEVARKPKHFADFDLEHSTFKGRYASH